VSKAKKTKVQSRKSLEATVIRQQEAIKGALDALSETLIERDRQAGNAAYCINKLNDALAALAVTEKARDEACHRIGQLVEQVASLRESNAALDRDVIEAEAMTVGLSQHIDVLIHTLGNVQGLPVSAI
jgi:undecaprenyl pyrophosphate synthase